MKKVPVILSLVLLCVATSVFADCSTLTNVTEVVPLLHVGETVHFNFEFIGGTEPYHFALVAGDLPPGVHLTGRRRSPLRVGAGPRASGHRRTARLDCTGRASGTATSGSSTGC